MSAGVAIDSERRGWAAAVLGDVEFRRLGEFIHRHCGIRCPPGKRALMESRLRRRLRALELDSFAAYCDRVFGPTADAGEIVLMIDAITTNKTDFFREPQHFQHLMSRVVPSLERDRAPTDRRPLSFWSAACSTGEEVYTLAMVLEDGVEARRGLPYTLLGSDISTSVLNRARRAIYPESVAASVPPAMRARYLLRSRDRERPLVRVVPSLRGKVEFRRANLLEDADLPRTTFDVIFCRNVFIYFDRATQRAVLQRLAARLAPNGYLFMGHADAITGLDAPLTAIAHAVFRKAPLGTRD